MTKQSKYTIQMLMLFRTMPTFSRRDHSGENIIVNHSAKLIMNMKFRLPLKTFVVINITMMLGHTYLI